MTYEDAVEARVSKSEATREIKKHGIDPAVELYVDTSLHANHNLLFLASIGYAADDVPSSAGMVLN